MENRNLAFAALLAAGLLLAPSSVEAQTRIDETRPANADVRIEVSEIIVGSLRVVGWDRNEIRITGELEADVESLEIEGSASAYEIAVEWEDWDWEWDWDDDDDSDDDRDRDRQRRRDRRNHSGHANDRHRDVSVDLEIHAPRGAVLEIEGVTLGIDIEGIDGSVDIETVTGNIEFRGNARSLALATVTGTIRVESPEVDRLDVETVQGRIEFVGGFAPRARASFEAVGGSILLRVPADTSATFDVETMSGGIENDFGQEPVRENRWVPSAELRFSLGSGGARVSIETLQGQVEIRRQ